MTAAFIRTSARSIASTSGANSSITLARDRPFGDRRGGVAGPGDERYFRTVLRSNPVSLAISDKLSAPDSNSPRKRRSSNQRSESKSIARPLSAASPTSSRVPSNTPHRINNCPYSSVRRWGRNCVRRQQVVKPVTPQEKVSAIHTLARDEEIAATVTGDLLRRPAVVAQVKDEDKVRAVAELTREDKVAAAVAPDFLRRPAVVAHVATADKVKVVEELTRDEHVAAEVTTGLLRRPDVAFRAMSDDTARHQVNHAQVERGRQAREHFEETSPVAPAIRSIDRSVEFLDLVTACHAFVAASGRVVPGLRDRQLGDDERTIIHENVARVRATLDWIETAVDTGQGGRRRRTGQACCKASRRCLALPSAGRPPPSGTQTPSGSCCSRPARPV